MAVRPNLNTLAANALANAQVLDDNFATIADGVALGLSRNGTTESNNAMLGDLDMGAHRITGMADPISNTDGVNRQWFNANLGVQDAQAAAAAAEAAQVSAEAAEAAAESYAAGLNLPGIDPGDAGKVLAVNSGETGFELLAQSGSLMNITAYGAIGDGVADDTSAIQAAIDAAHSAGGGVVYVPAGTYRVTAQLEVYSNITILGTVGGSKLLADAVYTSGSDGMIHNASGLGDGNSILDWNIRIQGITLDGGGDGNVLTGFWFESLGNSVISQCEVTRVGRTGSGMGAVYAGTGVNFVDCYFHDNTAGSAMWVTNFKGNNSAISNCYIDATGMAHGIRSDDYTDGILVTGNYVTGADYGIRLDQAYQTRVTDNNVDGCGISGIVMSDADRTVVAGNIVNGTGQSGPGINISSSSYVTIAGNTSTNAAASSGIFMSQLSHSTCTGNTCSGNTDGIKYNACAQCIIDGNDVTGNTGRGVAESGSWSDVRLGINHGGAGHQCFTLYVVNDGGTLKHSIGDSGNYFRAAGYMAECINNHTNSTQVTPTGDDSTTGFAYGGKIRSGAPHQFVFDTKASRQENNIACQGQVVKNTSGTPLAAWVNIAAANINGVAKPRLQITLLNATTGANFNFSSLSSGQYVVISVEANIA